MSSRDETPLSALAPKHPIVIPLYTPVLRHPSPNRLPSLGPCLHACFLTHLHFSMQLPAWQELVCLYAARYEEAWGSGVRRRGFCVAAPH